MIFALPVRSETLSFGPKLGVQPPVGSFLSSLLSATYRFKLRDLFPGLSLCPTKPSTCPHPSGSFHSTQASAAFLPSYGPDRLLLLLCLNSSAFFSPVSPVPRSELSRVRSPPPDNRATHSPEAIPPLFARTVFHQLPAPPQSLPEDPTPPSNALLRQRSPPPAHKATQTFAQS